MMNEVKPIIRNETINPDKKTTPKMKNEKFECVSTIDILQEQEYTACFAEFTSITNEYQAMLELAQITLIAKGWSNQHKQGRVLSIGAGNGRFDFELFRLLNWIPEAYVAVEPSEDYVPQLKQTCEEYFTSKDKEEDGSLSLGLFHVIEGCFSSSSPSLQTLLPFQKEEGQEQKKNKFDIILMAHCFYYIEQPRAIMERCRDDLLSQNGMVLVFNATQDGVVYNMCHRFYPQLFKFYDDTTNDKPLSSNHLVTEQYLSKEFAQVANIQHWIHRKESGLNINNEISPKKMDMVISFILQINISKLPDEDLNEEIRKYFKSMIQKDGMVNHPSALIVCQREN